MRILVFYHVYGGVHLFDAALRALLGLPPNDLEHSAAPAAQFLPEIALPRLAGAGGNVTFFSNGEQVHPPSAEAFIDQHSIVYSHLLAPDSTVLQPQIFELFDVVLSYVRSPWDTFEKRVWTNFDPTYNAILGKTPAHPTPELYIEAHGVQAVSYWRQSVILARLLEERCGAKTYLHEWLFSEDRVCELASLIGAPAAKVREAGEAVKSGVARMPQAGVGWTHRKKRLPGELHDALHSLHVLYPGEYLSEGNIDTQAPASLPEFGSEELLRCVNNDDIFALGKFCQSVMRFMLSEHKGRTVVHIPARSGSLRLRNKNLKDVGGMSLLGLTTHQAMELEEVDEVFVNTDSTEYAEEARRHGATIPFLRPPSLSTASASLGLVTDYFLLWLVCSNYPVERIVTMYPTSPGREKSKIRSMLHALKTHPEVRSGYLLPPCRYFETESPASSGVVSEAGPRMKYSGHFIGKNLRITQPAKDVKMFIHDSLEESIDIDTSFDFALFEELFNGSKGVFVEDWASSERTNDKRTQ